jgi:hypothetical protein
MRGGTVVRSCEVQFHFDPYPCFVTVALHEAQSDFIRIAEETIKKEGGTNSLRDIEYRSQHDT